MTKMALVQPKSNMAGPMEVEDEFMDMEEEPVKAPTSAKTILKRKSGSPPPPPRTASPESEPEEAELSETVTSTSAEDEHVSSSVEEATEAMDTTEGTHTEAASIEPASTEATSTEAASTEAASIEAATTEATESEAVNEATTEASSTESSEPVVTTEAAEARSEVNEGTTEASSTDAAEAMLALQQQNPTPASTASKDGETFMLVMDESMNPNQLDQQTFYIDSNSLANGDLSNMVLHPTEAQQPQAQATNGHHQEEVAANGDHHTEA